MGNTPWSKAQNQGPTNVYFFPLVYPTPTQFIVMTDGSAISLFIFCASGPQEPPAASTRSFSLCPASLLRRALDALPSVYRKGPTTAGAT